MPVPDNTCSRSGGQKRDTSKMEPEERKHQTTRPVLLEQGGDNSLEEADLA